MKKLIMIALAILTINGFGKTENNDLITVKGITTSDGIFGDFEDIDNIVINIYEFNNLISIYNCNEKGEFNFTIPNNAYITVEFKKDGYISKRILFDTRSTTPSKKIKPFDFEVVMLKDEDGIEVGDFDFPMAIIKYRKKENHLTLINRSFTKTTFDNETIAEVTLKNGKLFFP